MPAMMVFVAFSIVAMTTNIYAKTCDVSWTESETFVNCSYRLLTSLPSSFPSDTTWLDLSHNLLSHLSDAPFHTSQFDYKSNDLQRSPQTTFLNLTLLKKLDLSYNKLSSLSSQEFYGLQQLNELVLSHNSLVQIHPQALQGLESLQTLRLDNNDNQAVRADVFYNLTQLQILDVSANSLQGVTKGNFWPLQNLRLLLLNNNQITVLETDAFLGLGQLLYLDVSSNRLALDDPQTFPYRIFKPLMSLKQLYLHNNHVDPSSSYPGTFFVPPTTLQTLSIDTSSHLDFGPDFSAMTEFKILFLDQGSCHLKAITNKSLEVFNNSTLEEIYLHGCWLEDIQSCAFCFLPNLKVLKLNRNRSLSLSKALGSLYGLQGQNMTVLDLSDLNHLSSTIGLNSAWYLRYICVRKVDLSFNMIQTFETSFLNSSEDPFVKCIEEIDASRNRIVGEKLFLIKLLALATSLVTFRVDQQYTVKVSDALCMTVDTKCKDTRTPDTKNSTVFLAFPPKLTYANFSGMTPVSTPLPSYINAYRAISLKTLDFSYNRLSYCKTTLFGFDALEWLSFRANNCYEMGESIFDNCPNLLHLDLAYLNLNPVFFYESGWRVLKNLGRLQELDLTYNGLINLDPYMLRAQPRLTSLTLANNRLSDVSLDLQLHQNLTLLDVSYNMLATLSSDVRHALDDLASRHVIFLRLRGNPILCACSNLDFVLWLSTTKVSLDADDDNGVPGNLTCLLDSGDVSNTAQVLANYDDHWRRCVGSTALGVAVSCFLVQLLGLLAALTVSRSWTHIRYYWKVMRRLRLPRREDYEWDAFLVYAEEDPLLRQTIPQTVAPFLKGAFGIRLLDCRDDSPEKYIPENILTNIEKSWKVVLLVTADFTSNELCDYAVLMVPYLIRDTTPDRVAVVFLQDLAHLDPKPAFNRLLDMMSSSCVFHMPPDALMLPETWEGVAKAIVDYNGPQHWQSAASS